MNKFGGNWTENKIKILVEYAQAYLTIMKKYASKYDWKLMYFDGFAGSGFITKEKEENTKIIVGAARRIVEIEKPIAFDMYYFVEKESKFATLLEKNTKKAFPQKNIHIANTDCNEKIEALSQYLQSKEGKRYKVLAYIDPCGMQLNWDSLVKLGKLSVDVWILIPTGMGVNRLLKKDGNISDAWLKKLEVFLGMKREDIKKFFYKKEIISTLFGNFTKTTKLDKAIEKSALLYQKRLNDIFEFVSKPYVLKNATNSIMFHFLMVSNNRTAINIANDIVKKYNLNT